MSKDKEIKEMSSMAGGAVAGATAATKKRKKMPKDYYLSRTQFIEEVRLRKTIQEIAKKNSQYERDERVLRSLVETLVLEAKKDIEETPHSSTAINLLEDLLKQILPNLETEFKTLTTAKEQRDSFRAHVVSAVSSLLETEDINKEGGEAAEEEKLISLDEESEMEEEVDIKVSDVGASAEDKFIDIDAVPEEPEPEDTFGIEGQDATGRALAQDAFNNIEKNIAETYAILHDDQDEKLFEDYLITNLKLYFDKWERELGAVTEPTTDEYEAEKDQNAAGSEAGAEFDAELGDELGGGIPAAGTGEELVQ
jgi:hypothetical protein